MKIVLIMASSVNGKITKADDRDIISWTSSEDKELFSDLKNSYNLIVMGAHTYEAGRQRILLTPKILRIVLTKNTFTYAKETVPGQLEFSDESPTALVKRLKLLGYSNMLLTGGAEINSLFFKENLIDELHLTIEPKLFGSGKNMIAPCDLGVNLQLVSVGKLNETGTLHCIYTIRK